MSSRIVDDLVECGVSSDDPQVRANTIYANEIRATEVQGQIYQTGTIETQGWYGKIEASVISASVIYARQIRANSVAAQFIYVHKLEVK